MDAEINHSEFIQGHINIPASKSYGQRAIALSMLLSELEIENLGNSEDELAALEMIKTCGLEITNSSDNKIRIKNTNQFPENLVLNAGESGLLSRIFSMLMLLHNGKTEIRGESTLLSRPMTPLKEIYEQLGVQYQWNEGKLPLVVQGCLHPKDIILDGSISSQFVSGALYYLAGLKHDKPLYLTIQHPTSIPYIDMTIDTIRNIGFEINWENHQRIVIQPSTPNLRSSIRVESDWSSASFWIVTAAIRGELSLKGLNQHSLQADIRILDAIKDYGAEIWWNQDELKITHRDANPFYFDATGCPDSIPILMILAIFADGNSTIIGTKRLIYKESNRLQAMLDILNQISITYQIEENQITISGNRRMHLERLKKETAIFNSYFDHRIAMSASILSLFMHRAVILDAQCVSKSYPNFYDKLQQLGANVKLKI